LQGLPTVIAEVTFIAGRHARPADQAHQFTAMRAERHGLLALCRIERSYSHGVLLGGRPEVWTSGHCIQPSGGLVDRHRDDAV
jgi:hypothetical protein